MNALTLMKSRGGLVAVLSVWVFTGRFFFGIGVPEWPPSMGFVLSFLTGVAFVFCWVWLNGGCSSAALGGAFGWWIQAVSFSFILTMMSRHDLAEWLKLPDWWLHYVTYNGWFDVACVIAFAATGLSAVMLFRGFDLLVLSVVPIYLSISYARMAFPDSMIWPMGGGNSATSGEVFGLAVIIVVFFTIGGVYITRKKALFEIYDPRGWWYVFIVGGLVYLLGALSTIGDFPRLGPAYVPLRWVGGVVIACCGAAAMEFSLWRVWSIGVRLERGSTYGSAGFSDSLARAKQAGLKGTDDNGK